MACNCGKFSNFSIFSFVLLFSTKISSNAIECTSVTVNTVKSTNSNSLNGHAITTAIGSISLNGVNNTLHKKPTSVIGLTATPESVYTLSATPLLIVGISEPTAVTFPTKATTIKSTDADSLIITAGFAPVAVTASATKSASESIPFRASTPILDIESIIPTITHNSEFLTKDNTTNQSGLVSVVSISNSRLISMGRYINPSSVTSGIPGKSSIITLSSTNATPTAITNTLSTSETTVVAISVILAGLCIIIMGWQWACCLKKRCQAVV